MSKEFIGPSARTLKALVGQTEVKAVLSKDPDRKGQLVNVALAKDGHSSMMGLTNALENREWQGMHNHTMRVAGASVELGKLLQLQGERVDVQLFADTVTVSHSGRRHFDEAAWYPDAVTDPQKKRELGDTGIGLAILKDRNLPPGVIDMVRVHGFSGQELGQTTTWNERLPMYLDFRISQNTNSLAERFGDLRARKRAPEDVLDGLERWAEGTEQDLFDALKIESYDTLLGNSANMLARTEVAIKLGKFTDEEVARIKATDEFTVERRKRKPAGNLDIAAAAGIDPEEYLARLQLHPEDINEKFTQPERWERYVRRLYINDAEADAFRILSEMKKKQEGQITQEQIDREFPPNSWWGQTITTLYERQDGQPYTSPEGRPTGIARAIEFYEKFEESPEQILKRTSQKMNHLQKEATEADNENNSEKNIATLRDRAGVLAALPDEIKKAINRGETFDSDSLWFIEKLAETAQEHLSYTPEETKMNYFTLATLGTHPQGSLLDDLINHLYPPKEK